MSAPQRSENLLEHLVTQIAQGVSRDTGEAFFRSLVRDLSRALAADVVILGRLLPSGQRIRSLAIHADGQEAPPMEYDLDGTPCANVVQKQLCSYPSGIQSLFPRDTILVEMGAEGYVGTPLIDSAGRCLGILAAVTRSPLVNSELTESLLQIFAVRAATELQHQAYEEALRLSERRFRDFVTNGNEAILRVDLDEPIALSLPEEEQIERIYQDAYVADANDQAARLFGRTSAQELIGARLDIVANRSDPTQTERLRAGIRSGWRFSQVERVLDGRSYLMTRDGIVQDGIVTGAWVTARDITELKQAEQEVRRLNQELQERLDELAALRARLEQDNAYLLEEIKAEHNFDEMVGASPQFAALAGRIRLVAPTSATVLITGETGTGKELVARAIHNLSPRCERPLVKINCAAISAGLVESELFGHMKGAFTGASERRIGRFEYAHGGTAFLDEVSELPLESQAKLLRVLQEQEFEPVGSNRTVKVDVRVLAATNRDLGEAVKAGSFRADLYYRLRVVPVEVPPLRDRREDIPALAAHFANRLARQLGRREVRIPGPFLQGLMAYDWPGNVRELENCLAHAIVLSRGELDVSLLPYVPSPTGKSPLSLEETERRHIEAVLNSTRWVVEGAKGAAEALDMNPSTLRSRMKRLGIQRPS